MDLVIFRNQRMVTSHYTALLVTKMNKLKYNKWWLKASFSSGKINYLFSCSGANTKYNCVSGIKNTGYSRSGINSIFISNFWNKSGSGND
jgi:hypothetical protein